MDLISRRAAIKIVDKECEEFKGISSRIKERLDDLPCAPPNNCVCCHCGWSRYYCEVKNKIAQTRWYCYNWYDEVEENGFCYRWVERKKGENK